MYYITYDNETVVYNSDHKQLVKCPAEQEAKEYIHDKNKSYQVQYFRIKIFQEEKQCERRVTVARSTHKK